MRSNHDRATVTTVDSAELYPLAVGPRVADGAVDFCFGEGVECQAPVRVRVRDPHRRLVFERVLRELPTRHSGHQPLRFRVAAAGEYTIEVEPITTLRGDQDGGDPWELRPAAARPTQAKVGVECTRLQVA